MAKFEKGNKASSGRPKGTPNKDTSRFKEALNNLFESNADNMIGWLEQMDEPKERFDVLNKFAEYLYPKLARQELVGDKDKPIVTRDESVTGKVLASLSDAQLKAIRDANADS